MPAPFDNPAAIACGCNHQQNLSGAVASGDFTNIATNNAADGVYTLNGSPVMIGDIIDLTNPDATFDPIADIDAGGMKKDADTNILFLIIKEAVCAPLLAGGFTLVIEGYFTANSGFSVYLHGGDYGNTLEQSYAQLRNDYFELYATNNTSLYEEPPGGLMPADAIGKVALTITADRMSASFNGGDAYSQAHTALAPTHTRIDINDSDGTSDLRLRSFAFFEAVDDADLPTLSAP